MERPSVALHVANVGLRLSGACPSLDALIGSTAFLNLTDLRDCGNCERERAKILFLEATVHWLSRLRDLADSGPSQSHQSVLTEIHECAVHAIRLLRELIQSIGTSFSVDDAPALNDALKHLNAVLRVTSRRPDLWTEYFNKLRTVVQIIRKKAEHPGGSNVLRIGARNQLGPHTALVAECIDEQSPGDTDRVAFRDLYRFIFSELSPENLSTDQTSTHVPIWNQAVEQSGIMTVVEQTLHRFQHTSPTAPVDRTSSTDGCGIDPATHALLNSLKGILVRMRTLYSVRLYLDSAKNVEVPSDGTHSTHSPPRLAGTSDTSTCHLTMEKPLAVDSAGLPTLRTRVKRRRALVDTSLFETFVGVTTTPPPSPLPEVPSVDKWIVKLKGPATNQKRLPWAIEESIALWHGVVHSPGSKQWRQIWQQSFRRSQRTTVDLKDRWRVIENNPTVRDAIAKAYQSWAIQHVRTSGATNTTAIGTLPIPVIVHSPWKVP